MQEIRLFPIDLYILPTILFTNTHILIMKKIYTLIAAALACAGTAAAQQLPDNIGSFDGTWEDCIPNAIAEETTKVGTEPAGWSVSNVKQSIITGELVTAKPDYTTPNDDTPEGERTKHSVNMTNKYLGVNGMGATAPAYTTLGTAWSYGDADHVGTAEDKSDGGSYGGLDFTFRPDAVSMMIKRSHATEASEGTINANEKATIIIYSWKGSTTSTVRVGTDYDGFMGFIGKDEAKDVTMTDRDKDVLGMITEGVTKSEDFELISKSENYIEGNIDTWTQKVFPIEYLSESTPEKLNIVIACSDYFNRPSLGVNNTLDVDDVALVYYSTLSKLTIGGSEIALTDGTYEYTATGTLPASTDEVVATTKSKFAEAKVTLDTENSKVIITVTNQGGADLDGKTSHTYTITYPAATAEPEQYDGYINAVMNGGQIINNQAGTVTITENGDGTCTFKLPNFSFSGMQLGDIKVENVTVTESDNGTKTYNGSVEALMLMNGAIGADVTLSGTITADDIVDFKIDVIWTNDGTFSGNDTPIYVTFTTESQAVTPAEPEEYNGYINAVMRGTKIIENQSATVTITENGDGTCTFLLPNFSFGSAPLGDIKVENVTITEEGETKKYNGEAKGLVLGDDNFVINADVTLSGTITDNEVDFKIDVIWTNGGDMPIDVTFTSGKLSSVEGINAATAAVYGTTGAIAINGYTGMAQVYNMGGQLVASRIVDGDATIDVTAGIYIVRIDGTNVKVIVK